MSSPVNLQSLEIDKAYEVLAYTVVKTNFGDSYILRVTNENDEIFEMWPAISLSEYINNQLFDGKKFCFIVRRMENG